MSIQTIINNATYLTIDKRKVTATSMSRSGHYKTSERSPSPYSLTIGMHSGLTYSLNRGLLEDLDTMDRTVEANISLAVNTSMDYLTNYQGALSNAQLAQIDVVATTGADGANIHIDTTNVTGSPGSVALFKKGDYIQPKGNTDTYRYPYQVTADVAHTTSSSVSIPLSRPFIPQDSYTLSNKGIVVGSACTWKVKMVKKPKYSVVPGDLLEFDDDFEFLEFIRKEDG